jgi:hypothetical protein
MSPREFETAKNYLIQAKYEALRAIASLQAAASTWSDYDLSLEEEAKLHKQLHLDLQEIESAVRQQLSPSRGFSFPDNPTTEVAETRICAEIPPFDPDEDF